MIVWTVFYGIGGLIKIKGYMDRVFVEVLLDLSIRSNKANSNFILGVWRKADPAVMASEQAIIWNI